MTMYAFYQYVATHAEDEEVRAIAQAKVDREDSRRAGKAEQDASAIETVISTLEIAGSPTTASKIASEVGLSTAKVASLLKGMRASGKVVAHEEIKGGKVVRTYVLA